MAARTKHGSVSVQRDIIVWCWGWRFGPAACGGGGVGRRIWASAWSSYRPRAFAMVSSLST